VSEIDVNAIIAEISVTNVVQHPNYSDSATPQSIAKVRRQTHWQAIAACFALIGLAILLIIQQSDDTITTAIGEHRSIVLGDGSILTLNTRTEIRYHLDEKRRHVDLLDGEALFNIAHDPTRPFIVSAGKTRVRALGTSFNIYKKSESDATVTVLEGLVAVRQEATPATLIQQVTGGSLSETNEIQLGASEQLHISDDHLVQRETGEHVKRAVEWTSRRLSFENAALEEVVTEFNRYNAIQL
ncbi:MAG: FecR domain-containing protein, partial [Halieaceae bacterium]